jgi:hypothetical protein
MAYSRPEGSVEEMKVLINSMIDSVCHFGYRKRLAFTFTIGTRIVAPVLLNVCLKEDLTDTVRT